VKRAIVTKVGLGRSRRRTRSTRCSWRRRRRRTRRWRTYGIHFAADALPPVDAFWSVTMYDGRGFPVANELDRHALGDRDPLDYNADGSLDIWIGHDTRAPHAWRTGCRAPRAGSGDMRLYAPRAPVLDGTWSPPPVRRIP